MSIGAILSLFGAIVGVAALSVAVTSPNTAGILQAFGDAFAGSLKAAKSGG